MKQRATAQLKQISEELEASLIAGLIRGTVDIDSIPKDALSKEGLEVYGGIDFMAQIGKKPPFSRESVLVAASDVVGADRETLRPYIVNVMKVGGGQEVPELLQAVAEQQALVAIVNEASEQLDRHEFNPLAFTPLFDVKAKQGLVSASSLIQGGKLPAIPTGTPLSLPKLQEASGGIFGLWAIGGKSGVGKSTLAVQVAIEVARVMPVIYYDMENGEQVLLYRIGQALGGSMTAVQEATKQFYIRRNARDLDADVSSIPAPAMIVIDSLQKLPTKLDQRRTGLDHWLNRLEVLKNAGYTVLIVSELNGLGGYKETGEIEYTADLGMQILPVGDGIVTLNVVKNRHRPAVGEICDLERVNDWWFQEAEDLGGGANQTKELGL